MADRQAVLKIVRWSLAIALGLQVVLIVLLFGRQPLLLRWFIYPRARVTGQGMGLAVYDTMSRSGTRQVQRTPGALARLENPNTSLEAYGIWEVKKGGTHTLSFSCDDYGAVFIDGQPVIRLDGLSAYNMTKAVVSLGAGPHLLVIHLSNGPDMGFFRLDVSGPGQETQTPLPPLQLRPLDLGYYWDGIYWGGTWVRTMWFWAAFLLLLLLTLSFYGARTLRQGAFNVMLFLGGCLLAAVFGEITARLFFKPPQAVFFKEKSASSPSPAKGDNPFYLPTERGFRHRPNAEVTIRNHPAAPQGLLIYKTNSLGYRDQEIGPKTGRRILFLGDSITFGLGMPEEHIFVRRVEDLARERGDNWETINSAVGGLGLNAELAVLTETGLSLQPDLVVLCFYLNDFQESPGVYLVTLPGILNRSWLAHKLANVTKANLYLSRTGVISSNEPLLNTPEGFPAWQEEFKKHSTVIGENQQPDQDTLKFNEKVLAEFTEWGGSFSPHVWNKIEALLKEMVRLAGQHKFQLAIIAFPVSHQVAATHLFDYPQQRLKGIARSLDMPFLDLLPVFRREYDKSKEGKDWLFYDDCHLVIRGHQVTAEAIYHFLKQVPFGK